MKKATWRFILLLAYLTSISTNSTFCQKSYYQQDRFYSVPELKEDFIFFRKKLESGHPNLYLYTTRTILDQFFDSLFQSITRPQNEQEFYNLLALVNSKVKDGHTMVLPGTAAMDFFNTKAKFFPGYVRILDGRIFITMFCSKDSAIKEGVEILSINGMKANELLSFLLERQIRDGENETYPIWILDHYFKEYYSFSFGNPEKFNVTTKDQSGNVSQVIINALTKDSIRYYRQAKYGVLGEKQNENKGLITEIDEKESVAILTIKIFDETILKRQYNQQYSKLIKDFFEQLENKKITHLILDLRNNQGGDFETPKELLSYLISDTISFLSGSKASKLIRPEAKVFKGQLVVLINGGSFSSTGIFCSYLQLRQRAVFIGEESAGNKVIISGGGDTRILPNTRINLTVATEKYIIRSEQNNGHGIIPDYIVHYSIGDLLNRKDLEMQLGRVKIKEHKK